MSLKVGITGGIGSGKSFVSRLFQTMHIPFYNADVEAKLIMVKNDHVREAIRAAFGPETYFDNGALNKEYLSAAVFSDKDKLTILNNIVHPAVIKDAEEWALRQHGPYSLKEAALLYESGSYKKLDYTILVSAPEDLRIKRVIQRDKVSQEEVLKRMSKQMPEEDKIAYADFIIYNDGRPLIPQVLGIHHVLTQS